MNGFELFLISTNDPFAMNGDPVDPGRFNIIGVTVLMANPKLDQQHLKQWAEIEEQSDTSVRNEHHLQLPEWWVGMEGCQVSDGEDWTLWLKDRVNAWSNLSKVDKDNWEMAACGEVVTRKDIDDWFLIFTPFRLVQAVPIWFFPSLSKVRTPGRWIRNTENVGEFATEHFRRMLPESFLFDVSYQLSRFGFNIVEGPEGFVFEEIVR